MFGIGASDTGLGLLVGLVVVAFVVIMLLVATVSVQKVRRDRRENRHDRRRARYTEIITSGGIADNGDHISIELTSTAAQLDFLAVALRRRSGINRSKAAIVVLASPAIIVGLHRQATARSPVRRGRALLLLAWLEPAAVVPLLAQALNDPDSDVRSAAARGLAVVADDSAARALIDGLAADGILPDARIVERLAEQWACPAMLSRLAVAAPGPNSQPLTRPATSASQSRIRLVAGLCRALGLTGEPAAEPMLAQVIRYGDREERLNAIRAMATCSTGQSGDVVLGSLCDEDAMIRVQAASSVGALAATGHLDALEAIPPLVAAMSDRDWWVRTNASRSLGLLGSAGRTALLSTSKGNDRYAADRAREELALLGGAADA